MSGGYDIVAIGASWGALQALRCILRDLPRDFGPAIAIVAHRGKDRPELLGELLQERSALPVAEIEDKDPILGGRVYLAPADYHLHVEHGSFVLSVDEPVRFSRPSIDVALESVADAYRERAIGVVLTGANEDGARGLKRIAARGGYPIVQDPATAEVATMPRAALRAVPRARMVPLDRIAAHLVEITRRPAAPAIAAG